jgi:glycolate oxidase FAD binding subunit
VNVETLTDQLRSASDAGTAVRFRGSGSKDFYGEALIGDVLDTRSYSGIISYEPTELVVTAKAGTPLTLIEDELAAQNQMLAFEPPRFSDQCTIGGVVATGLSGPRRASVGAARDFILGASVISHQGVEMHFGGQVMKNVAGYDVSRLLGGSLGILGLITQVSLKVLPIATGDATVQVACDQDQALQWLNSWAGQPLPIACSVWLQEANHQGVLYVRLCGAPAAVKAAKIKLANDSGASSFDDTQAFRFWAALRDQKTDFFALPAVIRLSLPPMAPATELPQGAQLHIEWGGALRWLAFLNVGEALAYLPKAQASAAQLGGSASLYRQHNGQSQFAPLNDATLALHHRLKAEFDPKGIFNPQRLHRAL